MIQLKEFFEKAAASGVLRELAERIDAGSHELRLSGAAGGARALGIASAIMAEKRPVAVLTTSSADAQHLFREVSFYLDLLNGSAEVVLLPDLEVDPYRGLSPHHEISADRAQTLWRLLREGPRALVASVRAAAVRVRLPEQYLGYCMVLRQDDEKAPGQIRDYLIESGYVEDDPVTDPGEFSLRGGILDVFPPHSARPARLEFFGDTIESIRTFDADSQRSIETVETVELVPMREYCFERDSLRRWVEKVPDIWSEPFMPHLAEELDRARHGETFPAFEFMLPAVDPLNGTLFDYLKGYRIVCVEPDAAQSALSRYHAELYQRFLDRVEAHKPVLPPEQIYLGSEEFFGALERFPRLDVSEFTLAEDGDPSLYLASQTARKYHGNIRELMADVKKGREAGERLVFVLSSLGRAERIQEILKEYGIASHLCGSTDKAPQPAPDRTSDILIAVGGLNAGYYLPSLKFRVLTGSDIFDESDIGLAPRKTRSARRQLFMSDFKDLKPGDYVVHIDHGIGIFHGLKSIGMQGSAKEFVLLTYQNDAKLYVPVERLDLIQKYSSMGGTRPSLDRLGGASWARTKSRIKKSMKDMAEELLKLYARRQMIPGHAFSPDTAWQEEFEDAFEFELTRDQVDALSALKNDMEAPRSMDRLLCGDVGYGKTEVAMRAAFKAVMDGKQVAVLAPTTVLAFQHFNTFRQRFTAFPIRIQLLSRFRSPKEQKQVIQDLETGTVDIVVGTHRLLSRDVSFKDLGLVVVDEEQRFGVTHKERLKSLKTRVDVLTLSATPIPRTLNMALLGLRDMSTIETPPKNRLAIQTSVLRYSPDVIRSAIEMELARNGQVYFVHNRVETIHSMAAEIQRLLPKARLGIAHGQMNERDLEKVMMKFVRDDLDVLVATTIIENGLDIPRVNTIIINRADLYGLSQLYQLRGRVGRSDRRAYAYLLVPSDESLSDVARKRLSAIREFSDLGMGFRVAALDLEIRGAGNLLGGEQHGHIETVGFDLYCRMLEQTVEELRGEKPETEVSTSINLNMDIRIPEGYIGDTSQRLRMYKRISSAAGEEDLDALRQEMVDRFGRYPEQVENLFRYAGLRQEALALQIQSIERNKGQIFFRFVDQSKVDAEKLLGLVTRNRNATFSPQGVLALDIEDGAADAVFRSIMGVLEEIRQ
jgi:transcription-repair coupling factor (superfamily II helicase)